MGRRDRYIPGRPSKLSRGPAPTAGPAAKIFCQIPGGPTTAPLPREKKQGKEPPLELAHYHEYHWVSVKEVPKAQEEAQEEQQRTLEELSRIGGLLNAAERRAEGLGKSVEEAEKREVGESKRLRELEVGLALFTLFCSQYTNFAEFCWF